MFDIGFSELVLIALLALIVLGPKRLPEVARAAGHWMGKLRRFVSEVKQDFDRELHGAELEELRKLKQELEQTRNVIADSSSRLLQDISAAAPPASSPSAAADSNPNPAPVKRAVKRKASRPHGRKGQPRRRG